MLISRIQINSAQVDYVFVNGEIAVAHDDYLNPICGKTLKRIVR